MKPILADGRFLLGSTVLTCLEAGVNLYCTIPFVHFEVYLCIPLVEIAWTRKTSIGNDGSWLIEDPYENFF